MAYILANARLRLGMDPDDHSRDDELQVLMDTALAIVERYLDRKLMFAREVVEAIQTRGDSIQVSRYPISQVVTMTPDPAHQVHNAAGLIVFDHHIGERVIHLIYDGGYKYLPADLEYALWTVFDELESHSTTPRAAGSEISSVTITGVGTVRYQSASGRAGGNGSDVGEGFIPEYALSILRLYRLESA